MLVAGWWYLRNWRLYGDLLGHNVFLAILGQRDVPADLAQLWRERISFIRGYWEVAAARTRRRADVDLELKVVPTVRNGSRGFAMQLEARALNGRGRGRVLYSATRRI